MLARSAEALRILAVLLTPFIPAAAARIRAQLGLADRPVRLDETREWEYIPLGTRVRKGPVLFQKVDAHAEQP